MSACAFGLRSGSVVDAAVLKCGARSVLLRVLGRNGERIWLRSRDLWHVMPGHVARVRVDRLMRCAGHEPCAHGQVLNVRIDAPALEFSPLALELRGTHQPGEPAFEMELVLPGAARGDDPILDAVELRKAGEVSGAAQLLTDLLAADLRCLDAHAHLGNIAFPGYPEHALLHYAIGAAIGEHALGPGFPGKLPWKYFGNRPFLRCMHGLGLTYWRLGRREDAQTTLERLLGLDPADGQRAFLCWSEIRAGLSWGYAGKDVKQRAH